MVTVGEPLPPVDLSAVGVPPVHLSPAPGRLSRETSKRVGLMDQEVRGIRVCPRTEKLVLRAVKIKMLEELLKRKVTVQPVLLLIWV